MSLRRYCPGRQTVHKTAGLLLIERDRGTALSASNLARTALERAVPGQSLSGACTVFVELCLFWGEFWYDLDVKSFVKDSW